MTEVSNQHVNRGKTSNAPIEASPRNTELEIDLVELFYRLLKAWKLIVCLMLIFAAGAFVYTTKYLPTMYRATSVVYVVNHSDSVINISDLQLGTALTYDYIKVFNLWEVHEKVISKLSLPYSYSQMRSMLTISNTSNTRMLDITVSSDNPPQAALIANAYAEVFCDYVAENMGADPPKIMSVALVPANPYSPSKTKNTMVGALLGCILACGIVITQMLVDDKFKSSDDIRKYTGLVTLASIPKDDELERQAYHQQHSRKGRRRRK